MRIFWGICASFQKVHSCAYSEEGFLYKGQLSAKIVTIANQQSSKVSKLQLKKQTNKTNNQMPKTPPPLKKNQNKTKKAKQTNKKPQTNKPTTTTGL